MQKEEEGKIQSYLWDGNVAGMREDRGNEARYYFQDEMGSPIRLMDKNGELAESYGYDEFGQELYGNREGTIGRNVTGSILPFGYTGYQYDETAGTYLYQTITNAPTVYDLECFGVQIGGSASIPIPETPISAIIGGEVNLMGDINQRAPDAVGLTFAAGLGVGAGGEAQIEWGETGTIFSINIFDIWDEFYKEINDDTPYLN